VSGGKQFDDLIGLIYETVLEPGLWPDVLLRCARQVGGIGAYMMTVDKQNMQPLFLVAAGDADLTALENQSEYLHYYRQKDPRLAFMADAKIREWRCCHNYMDQQFVNHNEFYQDFLIPRGGRYGMASWIADGGAQKTVFGIHRAPDQALFDTADSRAAELFTGHLQRALQLQQHTAALQKKASLGSQAIDALALPMLIVDAGSRIIHSNSHAEALLRNSGISGINGLHSRLSAIQPADNQILTTLIVQATAKPAQGGATFLCNTTLQVFVTPLPANSQFAAEWQAKLALIVIQESGKTICSLPLLGKLYHLSPAELNLAAALLAGKSSTAYAEESGVKSSTVRTQINNLFLKTGTNKQADLLAVLSRGPPLG
jgi:DNA-binding CsgD family transcriptional regulator